MRLMLIALQLANQLMEWKKRACLHCWCCQCHETNINCAIADQSVDGMEVKGLFTLLLLLSMSSVDGSEGLVYIVHVVNVISWWNGSEGLVHIVDVVDVVEIRLTAWLELFFFVQWEMCVEKCDFMAWQGMDSDATPHPYLLPLLIVMYFHYLWPRCQARECVCRVCISVCVCVCVYFCVCVCVCERERERAVASVTNCNLMSCVVDFIGSNYIHDFVQCDL